MSVLMDKDAKNKQPVDEENEAPASETTPDEIAALTEQAAKAGEYWDRLLRLTADFDNYKKRAARERQEAVSFANENLLAKLLPVMDAFEMALAAATSDSSAKSLQAGIVMVANQLKSALAEAGLEEIDASGKAFDANLHEAVAQEETAEAPEGAVIRQTRKGYKFRQRLMRPAGVIVAKAPAP
jgi:molecular chaperone GrpE